MILRINNILLPTTVILIGAILHGCSRDDRQLQTNGETISFLLIKECQEDVVSALDKFKQKEISEFEYKIEKFSFPILSHPSLVGVVTLYSQKMGEKELKMLANNPITKCYPSTSFRIPVMDEGFGEKFQNEYLINKRMGISKYYIYVENGELTAYFHDPKQYKQIQ